jgi:hypothetical protein
LLAGTRGRTRSGWTGRRWLRRAGGSGRTNRLLRCDGLTYKNRRRGGWLSGKRGRRRLGRLVRRRCNGRARCTRSDQRLTRARENLSRFRGRGRRKRRPHRQRGGLKLRRFHGDRRGYRGGSNRRQDRFTRRQRWPQRGHRFRRLLHWFRRRRWRFGDRALRRGGGLFGLASRRRSLRFWSRRRGRRTRRVVDNRRRSGCATLTETAANL